MPWSFDIDVAHRILRVRLWGSLSSQDLLEGDTQLRTEADFRPDFDQIIDTRGADGTAVTADAIRGLTQRPAVFSKESRRAVVADTDFGFGMARMFELLRGDEAGEIRVFRDLVEAERWLGLDQT
jgi:hypothetical protein